VIDLSSLKTPGWARIVAELHAPAPDDRTFIHKLVAVLSQVSGARQGVLFAVEAGESEATAPEPRPLFVWPPAGAGEQTPEVMDAGEARSAARAAADSQQVRVFGLESGAASFYGEQQEKGYVIAAPVQSGTEQGAPGPKGVITLLIEPINTRDVPGFFLSGTDQALEIISAAGSDNVRLQYDIYHMQIMEGTLGPTIQRVLPHIGHIQLADSPGRHEPGTGDIDFPVLLDFIDRVGYAGWIGCEYFPETTTTAGLGWARAYLSR